MWLEASQGAKGGPASFISILHTRLCSTGSSSRVLDSNVGKKTPVLLHQ